MVDWFQFQGLLRWSLILFFMFLKAGLIMAFFMHLFWERYALVNVLLWPMTAIACFVGLMVAEFKYTLFSRLFYLFCRRSIIKNGWLHCTCWSFNIFWSFYLFNLVCVSIKVASQEEEKQSKIKINPYDNLPLSRKLIDKKNKQVGFFDLGNHILIVGFVLLVIFISINVE